MKRLRGIFTVILQTIVVGSVAWSQTVPALSSITPPVKTVGDPAFMITVDGSNFVTNSVVRVNGLDRVTTFVSPNQITAAVPASDMLSVRIDSVYVFNPAPAGRSNAAAMPVVKASTTTSLTSSANPSSYAQAVTLTATVRPNSGSGVTPGGVVSLKDGGSNLGSGVLDITGKAIFVTAGLTLGNHTLTVVYGGNTNFTGSTSPVLTQVVNPQIVASAGANGAISPTGTTSVAYGTNQTYTITPSTGYHVDSLFVDGVNQGALTSYTFVNVVANHSIRAVFAVTQFVIAASSGANGALTPSGATIVNYGSSQTFLITANPNYHIDSVIVDGAYQGQSGSHTFSNVTANHTIRAVFAINQFTITATAGANGLISPSGSVAVNYGAAQGFTVSPNIGYHIDSVLVDGVDQGPLTSYTFTNVTANHTIRTVYAIDQFTVTATASANGSISPSGSVVVNYGADQEFTVTAVTGYHVDSVIVDGTPQPATGSYTFANVSANHTIRVTFAPNMYAITAIAGPHGLISPMGTINVPHGGNQDFTIAPRAGCHIDSVFVDGVHVGQPASYRFQNVTGNHMIRAVFAVNSYTIVSSSGENGSIAPAGTTTVQYGGAQLYTMLPAAGHHVANVDVDGMSVGSPSSYSFTGVTASHTISVSFAVDTMTITATAGMYGTISPYGSVRIPCGSNQTFSITPEASYCIDSIFVDDSYAGSGNSFTFDRVTANHTITATFRPDSIFRPGSGFRTFVYDSMHVRKAVKMRPFTSSWEFRIVNTLPVAVEEVYVQFKNDVAEIFPNESFRVDGWRKNWRFEGRLASNDTLVLRGRSVKVGYQIISRHWLGRYSGPPLSPVSYTLDLPMPNTANVRDEAFARGAFQATHGLLVGIPMHEHPKSYGWARIRKSKDMFESIEDYSGYHTAVPRGFDTFGPNGKPFRKEHKRVGPEMHNNRLFADLMMLKFNIAISTALITPPGFGELRFVDPESPFHNLLVRDIALKADSSMTFWTHDPQYYAQLDSTIALLNASFSGPLDTISWNESLRIRGARDLGSVGYLQQSGITPLIVPRLVASGSAELPEGTELLQNYPNPFNPSTTIEFELEATSRVTLKVYNIIGDEVATLIDGALLGDGTRQVDFDASRLASGVYFYRLSVNQVDDEGLAGPTSFVRIRKMILMK